MFFLFFFSSRKKLPAPKPRTVSVHLHYTEIQRTLFEKFGKFLFCIRAKSNSLFLKITTDGIFCLSFAIWVLATSYTWKNLSRLCQFKIWLVPKRYKKTAGTDVTQCLTGCHQVHPGILGTSGHPWAVTLVNLVISAKVLISAFLIYGFMYIMWFVTACSFIWYLVWKFALQLSFGWWKIEELKIIKRNRVFT